MKQTRSKNIGITIYIVLLLTPIYWLLNMSFKTNQEILSGLTLWPENFTFANYAVIFTDPSWYNGYLNSMLYVSINVVITLLVALPAAYAFSRYKFVGDKHLFFWLLSNRMAPPAVFLLPFFQLYRPSACSIPTLRSLWRTACLTYRWRSGSWRVLCPGCRASTTKWPTLMGTVSRSSS